MEKELLNLADKLKEMKDKKTELDNEVKLNNAKIEELQQTMIDLMTDEEMTHFDRDGITFSIVNTNCIGTIDECKPELWDEMKEHGFENLFDINAKRLQGTVKELIENNGGIMPDWLEGLINQYEKKSIRLTKNKKY